MQYHDLTAAINKLRGDGYPVSALADGIGRVATVLTLPEDKLTMKLAALVNLSPAADGETMVRAAGEALCNWLVIESVETHLRLAWDRAQRDGQGLRLRLCTDSAEISAWPWEALPDPERGHALARRKGIFSIFRGKDLSGFQQDVLPRQVRLEDLTGLPQLLRGYRSTPL